ncbi:uncharacterized protein PGTG_17289 [Puccinia graminis f. sp. tritici CRL 75-36-700-3]|uniref:Uncharacterized protein n=1 Tax=Puccinia graminis f. sp. tritici (strain CRL 75-36-700-3 / race SCCL) TaxID=418459 RepID=E3L392_PUCGT|nr:uncharacterized protein PGTG_17289 [Puccinia graminis f. sp. tritici CRL 75-36-700-3]EFP91017.2 hypothetical protein PGTG_17289 [Puccinia graminis f. sp. tritici CRL 75-36-700-3]
MVAKPVCKLDVGQLPPSFVAQSLEGSPQTPFPLDNKNKGNFQSPGDSPEGSFSYQAYGFGLGGKKMAGMLDKKIQCTTKSIKTHLLQGRGSDWPDDDKELHLPNPLRENNNTDDTEAIVKLRNEMTFYSKLFGAINNTFLPKSVAVAQAAVDYLKAEGSNHLQENLALEKK